MLVQMYLNSTEHRKELSIFNYSESNLIDLGFSDITWKVENEVCSLLLASGWHWT